MFLYETSDYYYPWITGPVSQCSSLGVTGILSNGNTINIIPVEELFAPVPGLPTLYAQYVSNCCNSFGTGQWKYVGLITNIIILNSLYFTWHSSSISVLSVIAG